MEASQVGDSTSIHLDEGTTRCELVWLEHDGGAEYMKERQRNAIAHPFFGRYTSRQVDSWTSFDLVVSRFQAIQYTAVPVNATQNESNCLQGC